jgi:septum site-determining protein MinC
MLPRSGLIEARTLKVLGRGRNVDFTLDDQMPFDQLANGLRDYLRGGWFYGGQVGVNVGRRLTRMDELETLKHIFEGEFNLKVSQFSFSPASNRPAVPGCEDGSLLNSKENMPGSARHVHAQEKSPLYVKSTCRSGVSLEHDGDVIVRGDVNPGAQITATGDIIVFGTLRGIAHAGAAELEPERTVVVAISMAPLQLRIGPYVSVPPAQKRTRKTRQCPEIAYVSGRSILVSPYNWGIRNLLERKAS